MKKVLVSLLLVCWCVSDPAAQSLFSAQYPAGLPLGHSTGPSQSLAGSGVGIQNDFFVMADNPANLGGISQAVFSSFLSMDYLSINDDGKSAGSMAFSPQLLSFAFPLGTAGTFGFSLDRRTTANYKFRSDTTIDFSGSGTGLGILDTIDQGFARSGGVSVWQAGWGYAIGQFAKVGISYERVYFKSSESDMKRTAFTPLIGSYSTEIWDTVSMSFQGNGVRAGVLVPLKKLTLGFSGEYVFGGDIEKVTKGTHYSVARTEKGPFRLPPSLTAGASYRISTQWLAAASLGMTLWQDYYSSVKQGCAVDNAVSFSLGGQYIPAPNLLVPRYWEIMQYRAGFRYARLPVPTASEMAFTLSLGLPVQQGGGLFDIVLEAGNRSDGAIQKYSENFVKIGLGINGGRKWFQKTGIRY